MRLKRTGTLDVSRTPLVVLFADASQLATWQGLRGGFHEAVRVTGRADVSVHWSGTIEGVEGAPVDWDGGCGVLANLGEPVTVPVVEIYGDGDAFVLGAIDWGPRSGDVGRSQAASATALGEVRIHTGVLAMTSAPEPPVGFGSARLEAARAKGTVRFDWGVLSRVTPGLYEVRLELVGLSKEAAKKGHRRLIISRSDL